MSKRVRRRVNRSEESDSLKLEEMKKTGKRDESVVDAETRIIEKYKKRIKNPTSAIRSACVECMGGSVREIAECTYYGCSLYAFRMGTNTMDMRASEEYKEKMKLKRKR